MSLIDAMTETYILMEKNRLPDGEGGFIVSWKDGPEFKAAVTMDSTMQAQIAQAQGLTSVYTVTVSRNVTLEYHDVIRRKRDGKTYRITSEGGERKTPSTTRLDIMQVSAEGWDLT